MKNILNRSQITEKERERVLSYAKEQRKCMEEILVHNWVEDEVPEISEEELKKRPMLLALSGVFMEKEIPYTYEEYREHLGTSTEFAKKHENYTLTISRSHRIIGVRTPALRKMAKQLAKQEDTKEFLDMVAAVRAEEYYVKMMVAWYFATALAKQYDVAILFIEERKLEPWTHNKTIQKSVESYRIDAEQKVYLRSLKV